jgi:hypothetical protein
VSVLKYLLPVPGRERRFFGMSSPVIQSLHRLHRWWWANETIKADGTPPILTRCPNRVAWETVTPNLFINKHGRNSTRLQNNIPRHLLAVKPALSHCSLWSPVYKDQINCVTSHISWQTFVPTIFCSPPEINLLDTLLCESSLGRFRQPRHRRAK